MHIYIRTGQIKRSLYRIIHRIYDATGQPCPGEGGAGTQEVVRGHQLHRSSQGGGELELGTKWAEGGTGEGWRKKGRDEGNYTSDHKDKFCCTQ